MKQAMVLVAAMCLIVGVAGYSWAEYGAANPKEAAIGLLSAWKANVKDGFKKFVPEDERDEAANLLTCTTIKEFSVGEVTKEKDSAKAKFTWSVVLDADKFSSILIKSARAEANKSGVSEEEANQQIKILQEMMPKIMPKFKAHFEKKDHTMTLTRKNGRWFVQEPIEEPEQ